jgi:hypothetical protein
MTDPSVIETLLTAAAIETGPLAQRVRELIARDAAHARLYRYYSSFLRDAEIFCKAHAPAGHIEQQYLVPLCEDLDGSVWGYTSVPDDAIARWQALPDA